MTRPYRSSSLCAGSLFVLLALPGITGCGNGGSAEQTAIVVTADWINRSLTVFSLDKILDPSIGAEQAIVGTVDLSAWPPGPIEVEITADGRTAVVAVGPGFFARGSLNALVGSPHVEAGSAVLIVDLRALRVTGVIETEDAPLGVAITTDGTRAYTANFGGNRGAGNSVSVIDVRARRLIEEFHVDGSPEQIAVHADGTAILNIAGNGGARVFDIDDPSGTLSPLVGTGADPSDVTFLADSSRAAVANSLSVDVSLVDTSDPTAPALIGSVPIGGIAAYGVTYLPHHNQVLAPRAITFENPERVIARWSPERGLVLARAGP